MKRSGIWAIGIATFVSAGSLAVEQAYSWDQGGPTSCSNATLRGVYMSATSGYQSVTPSLVPIAVTAKDIFYGNGHFDSLATISIGGTIIRNVAAPGTYIVNSDCTATAVIHMTSAPDVHEDWLVAPDGDTIFAIETDSGTVFSGTIQRVAR
jgi:hypothetical protein